MLFMDADDWKNAEGADDNRLLPMGVKSRILKLLLLIIYVVYPGNAVGNWNYSNRPFKETIYRMSWKPSIECHRNSGF